MKNLNIKYAVLFILAVMLLPLGSANAIDKPPSKKPIYQVTPRTSLIPKASIEFREGRMRSEAALGTSLYFGGGFYLTGTSAFLRQVRTRPIIISWHIYSTSGRRYKTGTVRMRGRRAPLLVKFKPTTTGRYYLNVGVTSGRVTFRRSRPIQYVTIIRAPVSRLSTASITSAYLSAYVVPFSSWCRNHSARDRFEGRIHTTINFPRTGGPTGVPAYLVTRTGLGDIRSPVSLGRGRLSVSTSTLNFTHAEVCSDSCALVWLEARGSAGYRFDTRRVNACVR